MHYQCRLYSTMFWEDVVNINDIWDNKGVLVDIVKVMEEGKDYLKAMNLSSVIRDLFQK